jgi:hypothetical protein
MLNQRKIRSLYRNEIQNSPPKNHTKFDKRPGRDCISNLSRARSRTSTKSNVHTSDVSVVSRNSKNAHTLEIFVPYCRTFPSHVLRSTIVFAVRGDLSSALYRCRQRAEAHERRQRRSAVGALEGEFAPRELPEDTLAARQANAWRAWRDAAGAADAVRAGVCSGVHAPVVEVEARAKHDSAAASFAREHAQHAGRGLGRAARRLVDRV